MICSPPQISSVPIQHSSPSTSIVGRTWLPLLAWMVGAAGVAWLVRTPILNLRDLLRQWQFWSLEATVFVLIGLSSAVLPI